MDRTYLETTCPVEPVRLQKWHQDQVVRNGEQILAALC